MFCVWVKNTLHFELKLNSSKQCKKIKQPLLLLLLCFSFAFSLTFQTNYNRIIYFHLTTFKYLQFMQISIAQVWYSFFMMLLLLFIISFFFPILFNIKKSTNEILLWHCALIARMNFLLILSNINKFSCFLCCWSTISYNSNFITISKVYFSIFPLIMMHIDHNMILILIPSLNLFLLLLMLLLFHIFVCFFSFFLFLQYQTQMLL